MKKSKKETAIIDMVNNENVIVETLPTPAEEAVETNVTKIDPIGKVSKNGKPLGRKIDPNSPNQIKKREIEERRALGLVKRGRPVEEGSANYLRKLALEERKSDPNYVPGQRGRKPDPTSKRQERIAMSAAMISQGLWTGKPGRPKEKVKAE